MAIFLPDLNPIENFWVIMKSGLREKTVTDGNDELFNVLGILTMESHISTVFLSMRKILLLDIDADGGHN